MMVSSKRKSKKDSFWEGMVLWNDSYLKKEDGVINIGIDCNAKEVIVDFNKTNHIIVAGQVGSGKTVMIKSILWQFILKNDRVIAVDILHDGLELEEKYRKYC
ncbi:MAG: type IV secretion system DNA-binding domain-containing protein, partial [Clostridium perfringens]|nr:type IV secretion system DNA-binding domain-containing protein [Clostridium perfringens]